MTLFFVLFVFFKNIILAHKLETAIKKTNCISLESPCMNIEEVWKHAFFETIIEPLLAFVS